MGGVPSREASTDSRPSSSRFSRHASIQSKHSHDVRQQRPPPTPTQQDATTSSQPSAPPPPPPPAPASTTSQPSLDVGDRASAANRASAASHSASAKPPKNSDSSDFARQIPASVALGSLTSSPARLRPPSTTSAATSAPHTQAHVSPLPSAASTQDAYPPSAVDSLSARSQRPSATTSGVSAHSQSPHKLVESSFLFVPAAVKPVEEKPKSSASFSANSNALPKPEVTPLVQSTLVSQSTVVSSALYTQTHTPTPASTASKHSGSEHRASRQSSDSRSSFNSQTMSGLGSSTLDARSSFVLERAEIGSRPSMEMFGAIGATQIWDLNEAAAAEDFVARLPPDLQPFVCDLACFPSQSVAPIALLTQLWNVSDAECHALCDRLMALGIMKCTTLANGATWCLIADFVLSCIKHVHSSSLPSIHAKMLNVYERRPNFVSLVQTPDDGYIVMNVAHHLVGAKRGREIRQLLMSPDWLEIKLHNYGAAAVVDDFKQSLLVDEEHRSFTKLLLQAFQMSVSDACLNMPHAGTLKAQMVARLMMVAQSGSDLASEDLLAWWNAMRAELQQPVEDAFNRVEAAEASGSDVKLHPVHVLPLTPSLGQAGGFQRMVLQGHTDAVVGVLLTDSMTHIVTISTDMTARVWDLEVGTCQHVLQYTAPLTQLYSVGTGTLIMTLSTDDCAVVWDYATGKVKYRLTGHRGRVRVATVHPRGSTAVTCGEDGTCRMYNLQSGQCEMIMDGHRGAILDIDLEWDVAPMFEGPMAITGGEDFKACIWDLLADSEDPPLATLMGHSGWVTSVKMYDRGQRCITASHDGTARVWDTLSGGCIATLAGHTGRINKVVVHRNNELAITCSDDFTAIVWDITACEARQVLKGHTGWVNGAVFLPDPEGGGDIHAVTISGDELAMVWNCNTGTAVRVVDGHSGEITCCSLSARGRFLLTGSKDTMCRVWDLASSFNKGGRVHRGGVNAVVPMSRRGPRAAAPPDEEPNPLETTAITIGASGLIGVWDTADLTHLKSIETGVPVLWAAATSDRRRLITCTGNRHVCTWDARDFAVVDELAPVPGSRVKHCAISGSGKRIVTVLFDSSISVWDLETRECVWQPQKRGERDHRRVHSGGVNAVYISEDGRLAVTVSKDHTARVWDLEKHVCCGLLSGHTDSVVSGFLTADGRFVLTASLDGMAKVWDTADSNCLMSLVHKVGVEKVVCSDDQRWALTSCSSSRAWLWDLFSGQCSAVLKVKQSSKITGGCFSADSRLAITCSKECHLAIWHTTTARLLAFFVAESAICHCTCLSNGVLVAAGTNGDIHFMQLPQKKAEEQEKGEGSEGLEQRRVSTDGTMIVAKALSSNRKKTSTASPDTSKGTLAGVSESK